MIMNINNKKNNVYNFYLIVIIKFIQFQYNNINIKFNYLYFKSIFINFYINNMLINIFIYF